MPLNDNALRTSSLSKLLFMLFMVFRETDEEAMCYYTASSYFCP